MCSLKEDEVNALAKALERDDLVTAAKIVNMEFPNGGKVISRSESGTGDGLITIRIGIKWTMKQFAHQAVTMKHPFDQKVRLPTAQARVVYEAATIGPSAVRRRRKEVLEHYEKIAAQLAPDEKKLHQKLNPKVERIVSEKKILLFKRMLKDIEFDDVEVADLLVTGVKLIGELEPKEFWTQDPSKMAKLTQEQLLGNARVAQKQAKARQDGWSQADQDLFDLTIAKSEGKTLPRGFNALKFGARRLVLPEPLYYCKRTLS